MKKHIAISSNTSWYLYNFRGSFIRELIKKRYEVTVIAPADKYSGFLSDYGCRFIDLPMDNKGMNPLSDLLNLIRFIRCYRRTRPDTVILYTIKPVIYGSIAARILGIPAINTITGLGTAFMQKGWLMKFIEVLYRISQKWPHRVFFQNPDDCDLFLKRKLVDELKVECLPGSGVNLEYFAFKPYPVADKYLVFLLSARLLWDKGIGEYVQAIRLIKKKFPQAHFRLLGPAGVANRTAITNSQVNAWQKEGLLEYLGVTDDVRPFIAGAHCIVLPSYREGISRSLLEAAAMGRPVIATDVAGCREVVDDGVNGFLCRLKDADDLAEKMAKLIQMRQEDREKMGKAGREKVEKEFDEKVVIDRYVRAIEDVFNERIS